MISWIVPAIPAAVLALHLAHKHWPRSHEALYDHRRRELHHDMAKRGLTPDQRQEEMHFRYAKVRLREKATARVLASPGRHVEIISEIAAEEAKTLGRIDRSLARRFMDSVKSAHLADILYADALKAVDRHHGPAKSKVKPIDVAAVTTLR